MKKPTKTPKTVSTSITGGRQIQLKDNQGINLGYFILLIMVCLACIIPSLAAEGTNDSAGKISVTKVAIDPQILIRGDTGLVTVSVTNTGDQNVEITDGRLISKEITVTNYDTYSSLRTIGAGTSMDFSFTIYADKPDGIYYPTFYLNFREGDSLKYSIPVRVEEAELSLSMVEIPDTFVKGRRSAVTLLIGNPKNVPITGIEIIPKGDGMVYNQSAFFIGELKPHNATKVAFEITPTKPGNCEFSVNYWSGINKHSTSMSLPVAFGVDKQAADPVISNIEITGDGTLISGDVANAGLKDAYAVIISIDTQDGSENPNSRYVIGTLEPDDFSSFELSVPSSVSDDIPLHVQFKDEDGNIFEDSITINKQMISNGQTTRSGTNGQQSGSNQSSQRGPFGNIGRGMSQIPVTEIIIIILLIAIGLLGYRYLRSQKDGKGKLRESKR